ncbi:hypothetical protein PHYBLDRAFT_71756 [Phycomyces blakesleeanus NRRL 1555(-)]|uniref:Ras-GEF domain-containing protein n=2 Tax=Phycomyces blakesleeanus TaxID=4837 RepID=A0A167PM51_PHYB8|nr:hypothetical protein PHYBLDRAFT_71756 [Phycomyces blakesleeanus NRRL 1555(-)]OAD78198.1 hypothetical protein PHYBLDRAFT_71756 [Phycomyces blakesleeanus NRRL 1555(-)]|eukprot:XP_018296238.1 hypothetical protein PHYBLDRAFT_71756 [Phycomyces blakesleeanus NRRL 1555(-)]
MSNSGTRHTSLAAHEEASQIIKKLNLIDPLTLFPESKNTTPPLGQRLLSTLTNLVTLSRLGHPSQLASHLITLSTASTLLSSLISTLLAPHRSNNRPTKLYGSLGRTSQSISYSTPQALSSVIQRETDAIHKEIERLGRRVNSVTRTSLPLTHQTCQLSEATLLSHLHKLTEALSNLQLSITRAHAAIHRKVHAPLPSLSSSSSLGTQHRDPPLLTSRSCSKVETLSPWKNERSDSVGKRLIHSLAAFKTRPTPLPQVPTKASEKSEKPEKPDQAEQPDQQEQPDKPLKEKLFVDSEDSDTSESSGLIHRGSKNNTFKQLFHSKREKKTSGGRSLKELFHISAGHKENIEQANAAKRRGTINTFSVNQCSSKAYPSRTLTFHSYSSDTKSPITSQSAETARRPPQTHTHTLFSTLRHTATTRRPKKRVDHVLSIISKAPQMSASSDIPPQGQDFDLDLDLDMASSTISLESDLIFLPASSSITLASYLTGPLEPSTSEPTSPSRRISQCPTIRSSGSSYFSARSSHSTLHSLASEPCELNKYRKAIDSEETLGEPSTPTPTSTPTHTPTHTPTPDPSHTPLSSTTLLLDRPEFLLQDLPKSLHSPGSNTPKPVSFSIPIPKGETVKEKQFSLSLGFPSDLSPSRASQTRTRKEGELYFVSENGQDVLVLKKISCKLDIMAGTVDKLLDKLADETAQDLDYVDTFLMSYACFTSSMRLLDSLMRRFHPPTLVNRQGNIQKVPRCIQAKVLNVISRWVKLQCQDFKQAGLRNRLAHFIEHGVAHAGFSIEAGLIQDALDVQLAQQARKRHSLVALTSHSLSSFGAWSMPIQDGSSPPSPSSSIPFSANYRPSTTPSLQSFVSFNTSTPPDSPTFMPPPSGLTLIPGVLTLKAKDIARYLTLADFYIFRCITAYEYMHGPWRDPHNTANEPFDPNDSISLLAQRANMISHWVIHDVCTSQSAKQKRNIIRRLIEVAKFCLDWNNFHTSMVITMGLLSGAVQRLEDAWQSLPHRDTHTFEILQKNLDVCNNMSVYRNALQKAKAPAIPFFPLVLKDVTFFMDGNATMMPESSSSSSPGLINFGKFRSLVQFLDCTVKYTSENYYFAGDLEHLPFFPGVTLHRSAHVAPLDWVAEVVERRIQAVSRCHQDPYCEILK